jgi:hypothetical protein
MKRKQHFIAWLAILLFMVPAIVTAQTGYQMKMTNTVQVSCNVFEFDVTMNSTVPTQLVKLANFQIGILVNSSIVPPGAIVTATVVPGSSTLPNAAQRPGPEKFYYNPNTSSLQVAPVVPPGSANASTITMTGYRLFRMRVASTMPFIESSSMDPSWNFDLSTAYPTKVFGYIGTINTDITNPANHLMVNPFNPAFASTFPNPVAQVVESDVTEFCNLPGAGATISLANTQSGYSYYLYSDGVAVPGTGAIIYGNGGPMSFTTLGTGSIMSVVSPGCAGNVPMSNTISLTAIPPVPVSVSIGAMPGTVVLPGTLVTYTATPVNGGDFPFAIWHVNGVPDYNTFDVTYQYIPSQGDEIYCAFYPSAEVCTPDQEVFSNILTMSINELFTVSGGGLICEGTEAPILLSGSNPGIMYDLFLDGVPTGMSMAGTGFPLEWMVSDAGIYTVYANGLLMSGSATVTVDPLPLAAGPIVGPANPKKGTSGIAYSTSLIDFATTYVWSYTGTGVTINGNGPAVTLDFAVDATAGQLVVKGENYCGFGVESFFDVFPCEDILVPVMISICSNQLPYEWETYTGANALTGPGQYQVTYPTTNPPGCDSTIILTLIVNPLPEAKISLNGVELPPVINAITNLCVNSPLVLTLTGIPQGTAPLTFNYTLNGVPQTVIVDINDVLFSQLPPLTPGFYEILMTSITDANGCSVNPAVLPYYNHTFIVHADEYYLTEAEICEGNVYEWMGNNYTTTGSYFEYGQNQYGCLITYELQLTVNPLGYELTEAEICEGQFYTWRGNDYTATGTYFDYGLTVDGCVFTYELQLTVNPLGYELTEAEICEGDVYFWRGSNRTVEGTYFDFGLTVDGCLFTYELQLTVNPLGYELTEAVICDGDVYTWMGNNYDAPGTYFSYGLTTEGCPFTYELHLTVHPTYFFTETVTIYDNELPYVWHGNSYNAGGTYYANYLTAEGCDSIYELVLLVKAYIPLSVTKNIGRAVQAEWFAIPDATMYQLRYRTTSPLGTWVLVNQSTQLFRKLVPLMPGTEYELQLRHKVGTLWYPWSSVYAPVIFTTNVVSFESTYDIGNKFIINWTELDDVSSYILQYRKAPSTTWTTKGYYPTNQAVMGSMEEGTLYEYRVCPRYSEVSFDWSQDGGVTSNYINIAVANYTGTSADFSWDPLVNPAPSNFFLQVRPSIQPNSFFTTLNSVSASGFEATANEYRLVVWYDNTSWGATGWRPLAGTKEENMVIMPQNSLNVYPNPVNEMMTVEIHSTETSSTIWNLYDANGKLVMSGSESLTPGLNYFYIDATQLSTGLYMMQSTFNGTVESTRIIKQ